MGKAPELVAKKPLEDYRGNIRLQLISKGDRYTYQYSLDGGQTFTVFTQIPARYLLSNGYTGAYLGLYASSNGQPTDGYADVDWVFYQDFQR
jgi:alpha-N-arabinofuranosidase